MREDFGGLPGPLREQARGDQPAHALVVFLHRDLGHTDSQHVGSNSHAGTRFANYWKCRQRESFTNS
jgi:hypothetical protein